MLRRRHANSIKYRTPCHNAANVHTHGHNRRAIRRTPPRHRLRIIQQQTIRYMKAFRLILPLILLLASCASKKVLVADTDRKDATATTGGQQTGVIQELSFMQKVADTRVYAKNIVGDMTFSIQTKGDDISVPGAVHMRENEIIRLQLFIPLLGSEIGRIEFTPDHVLVIDRMHKEYIEASYDHVSFLKNNGINFYTLQALFWNRLFLPGQQQVSESALKKFNVDTSAAGETLPITFTNGNMTFTWKAGKSDGLITEADVAYNSTAHGTSSLNWKYGNFKNVGVKLFPSLQTFKFTTTATKRQQEVTVSIRMSEVKDDSKWDTKTTISSKYKKVSTDDIIKKLLSL